MCRAVMLREKHRCACHRASQPCRTRPATRPNASAHSLQTAGTHRPRDGEARLYSRVSVSHHAPQHPNPKQAAAHVPQMRRESCPERAGGASQGIGCSDAWMDGGDSRTRQRLHTVALSAGLGGQRVVRDGHDTNRCPAANGQARQTSRVNRKLSVADALIGRSAIGTHVRHMIHPRHAGALDAAMRPLNCIDRRAVSVVGTHPASNPPPGIAAHTHATRAVFQPTHGCARCHEPLRHATRFKLQAA